MFNIEEIKFDLNYLQSLVDERMDNISATMSEPQLEVIKPFWRAIYQNIESLKEEYKGVRGINHENIKKILKDLKNNVFAVKRIDNTSLTPEQMLEKSKLKTALPIKLK